MKKLATLLTGGILSASLVAAAPAMAEKPCGGYNHHGSGKHAVAKDGVHPRLAHMKKKLQLTDEQVTQIKSIMNKNKPEFQKNRAALKAGHDKIRALVNSDNFDSQKAQTLIDAQTQTMASTMLIRAEQGHQIYTLLTPEQKAKVNDFKKYHSVGKRG
ncbi:MAG: hypothetical protein CMF50_02180 [Legionellales bacterium]|nr:hypothetical protein [Legionellales bacterium]|tara:strand:+ start:43070 stop:43543 length:474 start_codon:yes stop_codon:yes gene_type:complete